MLVVNYNQLNEVTGCAKSLSNSLSTRINDYEGISSKLNGISTRRSNIDNANYFIRKKREQLQEKKDKVDAFRDRVSGFKTFAEDADKRVRDYIKLETKTFKKANKISPVQAVMGWLGVGVETFFKTILGADAVNWIKEKCRNIKYNFKDWYHDQGGKYILGLVVDVVLVGLAIAAVIIFPPAGILGAVAAGFTIYKAGANAAYDIAALVNFSSSGNRSTADRLDDKGGKEGFQAAFGLVGAEGLGTLLYDGLSIFSTVYSLGNDIKAFRATAQCFKSLDGSFLSKLGRSYRDGWCGEGFVNSFFKIRDGAGRLTTLYSLPKNAAINIANIIGLYKDLKQAKDLFEYVNIFDFNEMKFQLPTTIGNTIDSGTSIFDLFSGNGDGAVRIPQIPRMDTFKIPVMGF